MDSKIKTFTICTLTLFALLLCGCKENKWAEWKVQNQLYLEQLERNDTAVHRTSSGLRYKIIADPTPQDARPNSTSTINCDYTVRLINGYQVDGGNATLSLSSTIKGFTEGCHLIHNNGDILLYVPYWLGYDYEKTQDDDEYNAEGYGTEGTQAYIPPFSTLIYNIHICSVTSN